VERKKKTGRGRGRRGRAKKEAPEIKVKTEMSESGNMEIESEKPVNLEEVEQEKSEAGKGESSKQEIKTEFSPIITRHRSELQGTDNKTETIQIEDEEKKEETSEHHLQLEKNKLGTLFLKDSDNFYFFFKLPLLLKTFYEGLKVRAPVEDLRTLQQYLFEIYVTFPNATIINVLLVLY